MANLKNQLKTEQGLNFDPARAAIYLTEQLEKGWRFEQPVKCQGVSPLPVFSFARSFLKQESCITVARLPWGNNCYYVCLIGKNSTSSTISSRWLICYIFPSSTAVIYMYCMYFFPKRKSNFTENLKTRYFQALSRSTSHQSLLGMICGILSTEICERKRKNKKKTKGWRFDQPVKCQGVSPLPVFSFARSFLKHESCITVARLPWGNNCYYVCLKGKNSIFSSAISSRQLICYIFPSSTAVIYMYCMYFFPRICELFSLK